MYLLHLLDVWAYHLVVTVWGLFWPVAALICTLALVERWFALERKQPFRPWLFNLVCYAWFLSMMLVLFWSGWNAFIGYLSGWLQWLPPRLAAPESGLGVAVRLAVALVVYDFLVYWYHRLSHALPALWVLHRFHHDEQHVNAATSLRSHWLNIPLTQLMVMVPLTWLLGFNALPGQMSLVLTAFAAFTHLNVDFGLGRFTRLIVGPRYHRVHHDRERRFHDSNYADMFPLWDLWFGTFRDPELHGRQPLGLAGHPPTATYAKVMLPPLLEWWRLWRGRTATT